MRHRLTRRRRSSRRAMSTRKNRHNVQ
jgi:hypothetical protein